MALQIARIGDSKPAVVFRLAASPNAWGKQKASAGVPEEATGKGLAYQDFFQPVIDQLREKYRFTNARSAPRRHYFEIRSGAVSGVLYNAAFANSRRLLRAELYIDTSSGERNKAIFDALKARKNEIEAETGGLDWERLDHRRASRISLIRPNTGIEDGRRTAGIAGLAGTVPAQIETCLWPPAPSRRSTATKRTRPHLRLRVSAARRPGYPDRPYS